jgi:hypothetical protein
MTSTLDVRQAESRCGSDERLESILTSFDAVYQWNYGDLKAGLRDLYEKAKRDQWNGATQLDWATSVDPESEITPAVLNPLVGYGPYDRLSAREKLRVRHAQLSFQLSQFLHGEQGAMIVASQLVAAVPWLDAKLYASSQTVDEARHVEVFSRYVREKLEWEWPIEASLRELLDATIRDARWDFKYMGMQILIEGLAMAAFGNLYQLTQEPLLRELLRYVMRDESRHVAFGMVSLADYYDEMPEAELRQREEFIIYACDLMATRLVGGQVASAMGWKVEEVRQHVRVSPGYRGLVTLLFQRVVPNLKRLGLLTPRVREAFARLGILQFESYDPTQQDRALGFA